MALSDAPTATTAAWIDTDSDTAFARLGSASRFADLVRTYSDRDHEDRNWFEHAWGRTNYASRVASTAWRIATAAELGPTYVALHPRIFDLVVDWSDAGEYLLAKLELITDQSVTLVGALYETDATWWRDWPLGADDAHRETPDDADIIAAPYLMSSSVLMFWLAADLPAIDPRELQGDDLVATATACVAAIVAALNAVVSPAIAALERA
jgi:hypothetical protein